jgi:hypothetical protein
MSEELVQRFMRGLQHLEETRDPEPLIATYGERSETSNVATDRTFVGRDGAREFWRRYRGSFGAVRSSFRNVIVAGERAALEWTSEGTDPEGTPFRYDGVSVLEMTGEGNEEGIVRFRAFFDPAHLGRQTTGGGKVAAAARRGAE